MKSLTKKQIIVVNKEIRKAALKMRHNSNNPYEVIGCYTEKIIKLTDLIANGYNDSLDFETTLKCIAKLELNSNGVNK